jgi:hypothetical protein
MTDDSLENYVKPRRLYNVIILFMNFSSYSKRDPFKLSYISNTSTSENFQNRTRAAIVYFPQNVLRNKFTDRTFCITSNDG